MKDKAGVAGLFDALVFLAVASVVSVALLSTLNGQSITVDCEEQERTEAAHLVLLRSTLRDVANNSFSVEDIFELGKYGERNAANISVYLDHLLPGMEWSWTVTMGEVSYHFGQDPTKREQIFCSIMRSPWNDGEVVFRLDTWYP